MKAGLLWIASLALGIWATSYIKDEATAGLALLMYSIIVTSILIISLDEKHRKERYDRLR